MGNRSARGAGRAAAAFAAAACLAFAACSGSQIPTGTDPFDKPPSVTPRTPPPDVPGSAGSCEPGSPRTSLPAGIEVEGVMASGRPAYALFATDRIQPVTTTTVWWRVAGAGRLSITLVGPDGSLHNASGVRPGILDGWERPGEPWVSEVSFPTAGCWRVAFSRGDNPGDLWVTVG